MNNSRAEIIAQWWCDRIMDTRKHDNGVFGQELTLRAWESTLPKKDITTAQLQIFKTTLTNLLMLMDKSFSGSIGVDYKPDPILKQALVVAGLPNTCLPIKTWVSISNPVLDRKDCISGKIGYSGDWVEIPETVTSPS